jgi:tellurite methyltransferase
MQEIQDKWNKIYQQKLMSSEPTEVLMLHQHLLPKQGRALDLACGQGANAIALAQKGLSVEAWDISDVVIRQLSSRVEALALNCQAQVRNVITNPPDPVSFDVIVVSYFLQRELSDSLISALKPGGLLFYQTYCKEKVRAEGPKNPDFLLGDNELLSLFSGLKVRSYCESSLLGDHEQGLRNQAYLVAEKVV